MSRLIAIGLEQLGVEEFVEGNFFSGEIFLDLEKKAYAKLGFQRMSLKTIMAALITGKWKTATAKAKVSSSKVKYLFLCILLI